jgi:tRNA dimethylallyltransferase
LEKNPDKIVIVIAGPTAVGKTSLAIELAKHFQTEIISADSRQCFKELNIGVARPSVEELQQVPHHFINSHSIQEEVTAITFEQYALQKATALFKYHQVVVMVGGTGLYIKAFTDGLDLIPPINPAVRMEVIQSFEQHGVSWLQQQNPQRMMRALEVVESTGQSVLSFRKGEKVKRDFSIIKIGVELPKEELHRNIHTRVDNMMKAGLQEEVKGLLSFRKLNALQTVGYAELFDWLDGNISLEKAMEQIKTATRQYAKRQMTWFKKDKELQWFSPVQINEIIEAIGLSRS